jgi:hypothetical protein
VPQTPAMRWPRASTGTTLTIRDQHHRAYKNLSVSTLTGDCIDVENSTDITIEASQIGPCGGNGISVSGGQNLRIVDSYVHPETQSGGCCDHNDSIFVERATDVTIQGNVLAYGESNIEAGQRAKQLEVIGNFLLNPRGPYPRGQNLQAWGARDVVADDNYALSSTNTNRYKYPDDQEDSINFGRGSSFLAKDNYITGGHSKSGCGLIADDGANNSSFLNNRLVDTGGCGIGIASGTEQLVRGNRIVNRMPVPGAGNTALYVWSQYKRQMRAGERARQRRNGAAKEWPTIRVLGRRRVRAGDIAQERLERTGDGIANTTRQETSAAVDSAEAKPLRHRVALLDPDKMARLLVKRGRAMRE